MPFIFLIVFGISCLWLIVEGLKRREGVLEFGFLAGCGLFGFLFLQAVGVVLNPGMSPENGEVKALVMSTLCTAAVYLGWKAPARVRPVRRSWSPFSLRWMYGCGVACVIVGLVGFIKLAALSGGVVEYYSVEGAYKLNWQGPPVTYAFLALYSWPGLVLVTLSAARSRSWLRLTPAAIPLLIELANIIFLGRRTEFIWLGTALGSVLYFTKRIAPPRPLTLALAPLAVAAMFFAAEYRASSEIGADRARLQEISTTRSLKKVLSGTEAEFCNMAYMMEIADAQGLFQGGVGLYNTFVYMFVPKSIVGEELKAKLMVDVPSARTADNRFDWAYPYGCVPTGPFSVFEQFWYFGAICFYLLARWLKRHWVRAVAGDARSQFVYSLTVTFAVAAVVNDFFVSTYIPVFMFILPLWGLTSLHAAVTVNSRHDFWLRSTTHSSMRPSPLTSRGSRKQEVAGSRL
jgi:zinc transporter ZupT